MLPTNLFVVLTVVYCSLLSIQSAYAGNYLRSPKTNNDHLPKYSQDDGDLVFNLAIHGAASQSFTCENAENAIDGNVETFSETCNNYTSPLASTTANWWKLDLAHYGTCITVDYIRLYDFDSSETTATIQLLDKSDIIIFATEITPSLDSTTIFTTKQNAIEYDDNDSDEIDYVIDCAATVKIVSPPNHDSIFQIGEIQVFGKGPNPIELVHNSNTTFMTTTHLLGGKHSVVQLKFQRRKCFDVHKIVIQNFNLQMIDEVHILGHDSQVMRRITHLSYHHHHHRNEKWSYINVDSFCVQAIRVYIVSNSQQEFTTDNILIYGLLPKNIALGGTASQSCTVDEGHAEFGIDGNIDGGIMFHACDIPTKNNSTTTTHTTTKTTTTTTTTTSNEQELSWWRVDLDHCYSNIEQISIHNRMDCCQDRIIGALVQVLDDNDEELESFVINSSDLEITHYITTYMNSQNCAKAVKITSPKIGVPLHLAEVQVYGHSLETNSQIHDLTKNGIASQLCTFAHHIAALAIDNDINGDFISGSVMHTCFQGDQDDKKKVGPSWWRLDLESTDGCYRALKLQIFLPETSYSNFIGATIELLGSGDAVLSRTVYEGEFFTYKTFFLKANPEPKSCIKSIKITSPRVGTELHLSEIIVNGMTTDNLAMNGVASQSCTSPGMGAVLAIDGNTNGNPSEGSTTLTCDNDITERAWWRVDFGISCYAVSKIIVHNRADCCQERIIGASVEILDENDTVLASSVIKSSDMEIQLLFDASITGCARTIMITARDVGVPLSLAEVEVLGVDSYINIAPQGTATQSCTILDNVASLAIDNTYIGSVEDKTASQTCSDISGAHEAEKLWWRVDLPDSDNICHAVALVVLYNRVDCCEDVIVGATVEVLGENDKVIASSLVKDSSLVISVELQPSDGKSQCAKAVKLISAGAGVPLYLTEVEVYGVGKRNFALGGVATQSCTLQFSDASLAIDGNRNAILAGGSVSHTCEGEAEHQDELGWWRVDLGSEYGDCLEVVEVVLYNRDDCCEDNIIGANVQILSDDDKVLDSFIVKHTARAINATFAPNMDCVRAVKIIAPSNGVPISLAEVEVYGIDNDQNIARGGTAIQSCTPLGSDANIAIDGTIEGIMEYGTILRTCGHANRKFEAPWWRVDFDTSEYECHDLIKVVIYNRNDCCQDRIVGGSIQVLGVGDVILGATTVKTGDMVITAQFDISDKDDCPRAVRIVSADPRIPLNLAEVQVTGETKLHNLALNGIASQSCTMYGGEANLAIDGRVIGSIETNSIAHTCENSLEKSFDQQDYQPPPWWRVDLDSPEVCYNVKQINLYNRVDCCQDKIIGAVVHVLGHSDHSIMSTIIDSDALEIPILFDSVDPQCARAIMIMSPKKGVPIHLVEVEVFGDVIDPPENNNCENALPLRHENTGSLLTATLKKEPDVCGNEMSTNTRGVYYKWVGDGGVTTLAAQGNNFKPFLAVYSIANGGNDCSAGLECADSTIHHIGGTKTIVTVPTESKVTYLLFLAIEREAMSFEKASFDLEFSNHHPRAPPNDQCVDSKLITLPNYFDSGNNVYSQQTTATPCFGLEAEGVFYSLVGDGNAYSISTAGGSFRSLLVIYKGSNQHEHGPSSCKNLICHRAFHPTEQDHFAEGLFTTEIGQHYTLFLGGLNGVFGYYQLTISPAPPANNQCEQAIELQSSQTGFIGRAVPPLAKVNVCKGITHNNKGLFYVYPPGSIDYLTLSTRESISATTIAVYRSSTSCSDLYCIGVSDDTTAEISFFTSLYEFTYVFVTGNHDENERFHLGMEKNEDRIVTTQHDTCQYARPVQLPYVSESGTTANSVETPSYKHNCITHGSHGMFYKFRGDGHDYIISAAGILMDIQFVIYELDEPIDKLRCYYYTCKNSCISRHGSGGYITERLQTHPKKYYLLYLASALPGVVGDYNMTISPVPENNSCAKSFPIMPEQHGVIWYSNYDVVDQYTIEACDKGSAESNYGAYYHFVGDGNTYILSTQGSFADVYLYLFSIENENDNDFGDCSSHVCVGSDYHGGRSDTTNYSRLIVTTEPDMKYVVFIGGFGGTIGEFKLTFVESSGRHDSCDTAMFLPNLESGFSIGGSTTFSQIIRTSQEQDNDNTNNIVCASNNGVQKGVFFSFTGTGSKYFVTTKGSSFTTMLSVYNSGPKDESYTEGSFLTCERRSCAVGSVGGMNGGEHADLVVETSYGQDLKIFLSGTDGAFGTYQLAIHPIPNNWKCSLAIPLKFGIQQGIITNRPWDDDTMNNVHHDCNGIHRESAGVYFTFVGDGDWHVLSTKGSHIDTIIAVYTQQDRKNCNNLSCVDSNDDKVVGSTHSHIRLPTTFGVHYLVFVTGYGGASGDYQLLFA